MNKLAMIFKHPNTVEDKLARLAKIGVQHAAAYTVLLRIDPDQAEVFFKLAMDDPAQAEAFFKWLKSGSTTRPALPSGRSQNPPNNFGNGVNNSQNPLNNFGNDPNIPEIRPKTLPKIQPPQKTHRNGASGSLPPTFEPEATVAFRSMHRNFKRAMDNLSVRYEPRALNRGAKHLEISLRLGNPDYWQVLNKAGTDDKLAMAINAERVIVSRVKGLIEVQIELDESEWITYTRDDISADALGIASRKREVALEFAESSPHSRIQGTTGSGKTVALESAALSVMSRYTLDECKVVISDHHNVVSSDFDNVAYMDFPVARTEADAYEAITYGHSILKDRRENDIKDDYRLVIFIDELNELLALHPDLTPAVQELVNGRKYRVNVVAGVHDNKAELLPGIADQITNVFVGKIGQAAKNYAATGIAGLKPHLLAGGGDFYHIRNGQALRFQVAQATDKAFDDLPRAEILKPAFEPAEVILPQNERSVGRPAIEIDADHLAQYLANDDTTKLAPGFGKAMDLSKRAHYKHRDRAVEIKRSLAGIGYCISKCEGGSQ